MMPRVHSSLLLPLIVALVCTLSGCFRSSGEEPDFPKPITTIGCPDVTGTYRFQPDPDSQGDLQETPFAARDFNAAALTLDDAHDSGTLAFTVHRNRDDFERSVSDLRGTKPADYAAWLRQARSIFDPMTGSLARRSSLPFDTLGKLGPVPERSGLIPKWRCDAGWYLGDDGNDTIAMTRDVAGGLLVRFDQVERRVIGVWAENPSVGIPYYIRTTSRWARFAPVETPSIWRPPMPQPGSAEAGVVLHRDDDPRVAELRYRTRRLLAKDAMLINFRKEGDEVLFTAIVASRGEMQRVIEGLRKDDMVAGIRHESTMDMSFGRVRFVVHVRMRPG
jgi:hypothetical protein